MLYSLKVFVDWNHALKLLYELVFIFLHVYCKAWELFFIFSLSPLFLFSSFVFAPLSRVIAHFFDSLDFLPYNLFCDICARSLGSVNGVGGSVFSISLLVALLECCRGRECINVFYLKEKALIKSINCIVYKI